MNLNTNRLYGHFGYDGTEDEENLEDIKQWPHDKLKPFNAYYTFNEALWNVTIWAHNWHDAHGYAQQHSMVISGFMMPDSSTGRNFLN